MGNETEKLSRKSLKLAQDIAKQWQESDRNNHAIIVSGCYQGGYVDACLCGTITNVLTILCALVRYVSSQYGMPLEELCSLLIEAARHNEEHENSTSLFRDSNEDSN